MSSPRRRGPSKHRRKQLRGASHLVRLTQRLRLLDARFRGHDTQFVAPPTSLADYAALRCAWRPSATSSMIFLENASRSPGLREVITPWSLTTWESSQFAPALITSVLIDFYDVAFR